MLKNNIDLDEKIKCIENGMTQAQVAADIDTTKSYVNRVIKKENVLNNTFVRIYGGFGL